MSSRVPAEPGTKRSQYGLENCGPYSPARMCRGPPSRRLGRPSWRYAPNRFTRPSAARASTIGPLFGGKCQWQILEGDAAPAASLSLTLPLSLSLALVAFFLPIISDIYSCHQILSWHFFLTIISDISCHQIPLESRGIFQIFLGTTSLLSCPILSHRDRWPSTKQ